MNKNPFVLPGFGQGAPLNQNPMLASMEMMRQAWEGLASAGGMDPAAAGRMMSVEEMDKRIADLRAVENWLRMNLSMLSSTIQALEVQRATMATLQSFVDTGLASMASPAAAAQGGSSTAKSSQHESQAAGAGRDDATADDDATPADENGSSEQGAQASAGQHAEPADIMGATATAAQGWWNLMQQQFQTLAAATAASAEEALSDLEKAGEATGAAAKKTAAPAAGKTGAKAATGRKSAARKAGKKAAKTTARKTPR